ncbi:uncharacterized protein PG986_010674 [Apiospora aurea]|uniref:Uncharacterized protein n=1 Tax=Apiospora aurea TaxID=335848 RepID=A0ABR1Q2X1_9PEZI
MEAGRQFQNLDLLKLLVRGNKRGAADNTHLAEPVARTPTPNTDVGPLPFSGFGPEPCLDLKPMAATEAIMMDTNLCSSSAAPPPYQLYTSPLPPDSASTDRPQSAAFIADGLKHSLLQTTPRLSNASLPKYEAYCDPPSSSSPSNNDLAPEQLRNGLKALFQVSTPLASRPRLTSRATTVSAVSISNNQSVTGPEREEKRHSAASELPERANSDPTGQLRSRSPAHAVGAPMQIRDLRKSEPYGRRQDTQYTLRHAFNPLMAELDGTAPESRPVELNTEPRYAVAELAAGTEEVVTLDTPRTQTRSVEGEDDKEKIVLDTVAISIAADTPGSNCMAEDKDTPSRPLSTETNRMGLFKDRGAQVEWLRRSDILQP